MTEEQKQRARENARKYYYAHKEEILRKQKEYRKEKLETDEEYKKKYNQRWKKFNKIFKEKHPNYKKEWDQKHRKLVNSYKSRCERAIEYIKTHSKCGGSIINGKFIIEQCEEIFNGMELLKILMGDKDE